MQAPLRMDREGVFYCRDQIMGTEHNQAPAAAGAGTRIAQQKTPRMRGLAGLFVTVSPVSVYYG